MKLTSLLRLAGGLLVVLGTVTAYAQTSSAPAEASTEAPASASARSIRQANRLLARDVRRTLVRVRGLDSGNIVVVARGGSVMLGGSVPAASQIELATEAAKGVKGVTSVSEKLTIRAVGQ